MSTVTAADINKLRQMTGAGMMDCRSALTETNGDFEAAIDFLRKKGQKVAAKRSDREANEGVVIAKVNSDATVGIVMNLTSETDFVSKNADFQSFAVSLSQAAIDNNCKSLDEFKACAFDGSTVAEKILEQVGKIGEKIDVTMFKRVEAPSVVAYNHGGYRVAVLIGMNQAINSDVESVGKDLAMQAAAMNPVAIDEASVPAQTIERERNIIMDTMKQDPKMQGKPEEMIAKIAEGKLNAFFKENTLLAQQFVKDNSKTVAEYISSVNKDLKVVSMERESVGA